METSDKSQVIVQNGMHWECNYTYKERWLFGFGLWQLLALMAFFVALESIFCWLSFCFSNLLLAPLLAQLVAFGLWGFGWLWKLSMLAAPCHQTFGEASHTGGTLIFNVWVPTVHVSSRMHHQPVFSIFVT